MPYSYLLFCVLLAWPMAAAGGTICQRCDTPLLQKTDSLIMLDAKGIWHFCKQVTFSDSCLKQSGAGKAYLVQGTSKIVYFGERVIVAPGITAEQATIALHHPDSLTSVAAEYGGLLWLTKRIQGIVYHGRDEIRTVLREQRDSPVIALITFGPLLMIIIFSFFCAFTLPKKRWSENALSAVFGCLFSAALAAILAIEADAVLNTAEIGWLAKLPTFNLVFILAFIALIAKPIIDLLRICINQSYRFKTKATIRGWVMPLGIFTIIELAIFAGLETKKLTCSLSYLAIAIGFFALIDFVPACLSYRKNKRLSRNKT